MLSNIPLRFVGTSGKTLVATLERVSDGYFWNPTASAWQNAPSFANKSISLTEGTSENLGSYAGSASGLGDAQEVIVRIHDTGASNQTIGEQEILVVNGLEVLEGDVIYRDMIAARNSQLFFHGALVSGNVNDAAAAASGFKGNSGLSSSDNWYVGSVLSFTGNTSSGSTLAANEGIARRITGYVGATRAFSFATSFPAAPANGDTFVILGRID